jgi:hypothetical protein
MVSRQCVFVACVVGSVAYMALAVASLIAVEVVEALFAASRQRSGIPVVGIIAVVHVAIEATVTVEPRTRPDEDAARKPVRAIVAVWRAVVRRVIKVTVGASRCNAYTDGNLG